MAAHALLENRQNSAVFVMLTPGRRSGGRTLWDTLNNRDSRSCSLSLSLSLSLLLAHSLTLPAACLV